MFPQTLLSSSAKQYKKHQKSNLQVGKSANYAGIRMRIKRIVLDLHDVIIIIVDSKKVVLFEYE